VRRGDWDQLLPGEAVNLDGKRSFFTATEVDQALLARCHAGDVHPSGPLAGRGEHAPSDEALRVEKAVLDPHGSLLELLANERIEQERRSLRLAVRNLEWTREPDAIVLRFRLTRGSFATTVLREIFDVTTPDGDLEGET